MHTKLYTHTDRRISREADGQTHTCRQTEIQKDRNSDCERQNLTQLLVRSLTYSLIYPSLIRLFTPFVYSSYSLLTLFLNSPHSFTHLTLFIYSPYSFTHPITRLLTPFVYSPCYSFTYPILLFTLFVYSPHSFTNPFRLLTPFFTHPIRLLTPFVYSPHSLLTHSLLTQFVYSPHSFANPIRLLHHSFTLSLFTSFHIFHYNVLTCFWFL